MADTEKNTRSAIADMYIKISLKPFMTAPPYSDQALWHSAFLSIFKDKRGKKRLHAQLHAHLVLLISAIFVKAGGKNMLFGISELCGIEGPRTGFLLIDVKVIYLKASRIRILKCPSGYLTGVWKGE
jgi:hypothetical protein